jgi:HD-GYP domain-containing protein (c-di-GMP phosphodiesterase class II)
MSDSVGVMVFAGLDCAAVLTRALEAHDVETHEHSRDVVDLSLAVADALNLDAHGRSVVELGALLHDVGKLAVAREVLHKVGPLDEREWALMHRHTIEGQRMVVGSDTSMATIGQVVRSSHERWDGWGYPDGLCGEAIPLAARVVAVADAYSAMTTDRPYRRALSAQEARRELGANAGTQFDPAVVDAALVVLAEG